MAAAISAIFSIVVFDIISPNSFIANTTTRIDEVIAITARLILSSAFANDFKDSSAFVLLIILAAAVNDINTTAIPAKPERI